MANKINGERLGLLRNNPRKTEYPYGKKVKLNPLILFTKLNQNGSHT